MALFIKMAEYALATLDRVTDEQAIPAAVAAFLVRENLPTEVVMAPDAALAGLPWESQPLLKIKRRRRGWR